MGYDHLTREALISVVRELEAARATAASPTARPDFPVFGERALREFEASASPMRIFDLETCRYLAVNEAAVRFYGYSREEFLGLTVKDTRHPDEHDAFAATLAEQADYLRHRPLRRQVKKSGELVVAEVITQDILFQGRRARLCLTMDMTSRLRMQELLWQRQQEFEALAENIPHLVARFDAGHRYLYVNTAVEKLLGISRHEVLGKSQRELGMPEALVERFERSLDDALRGGEPHMLEFSMGKAAGERHFEAYHVPEPDASGKLSTVLCIAHDVTERTATEQTLRETNEFLRSVIESSRNCIKVLDLEGRLLLMNAGGQRLLEMDDVAPFLNTEWPDLWPEAEREKVRTAIQTAREGSVGAFEGYAPTLKGTPRWWESTITPMLGADGKPARLLAVSRDISARKQARDMQSRLAAIVNNSTDAIFSIDLEGAITTWNPGAERLFGYGAEQVIGQPVAILVPPELRVEDAALLDEVRRGRQVEAFESVRCRRNGAILHVSMAVSPIRDDHDGILGASMIIRDITERKYAELAAHRSAALARLLESLARAANEALTPAAAMAACLELICAHGNWTLGRVKLFAKDGDRHEEARSIWFFRQRESYREFIRISNEEASGGAAGFISRVRREQTAVWIEDLSNGPAFRRRDAAISHGLRSAFAFPIIVRGIVVAFMELYADEPRPQEPTIIGAAHSMASQLARIVEREWAQQANARMAAIVEFSQDAIVSCKLDGTITTWNPAAERLLGYRVQEAVGRNILMLVPPELHPEFHERNALFQKGLAAPAQETVRLARDGRRIHVSISAALIRDAGGSAQGISSIIQDITQRKLAEQDLRESEERFRLLAENIDQVFWINTLAADRNLYLSPAFEKIWGRSRESVRGAPNGWMASVHHEDLPRLRQALDRVASGDPLDVEYRIIRPDGTIRWIRDRSYPMTRGDGTPLLCGLAQDITREKRLAAEQLEKAVGQRDALVREVHHRIKNSLQGVAGLLRQKMRKYPAISPGMEEAIAQLQSVALVYGLQGTRADGLLSLAEVTDAICSAAESLIGGRVERSFERQSLSAVCIAGPEAVSVAVALNELVFNALKHQRAAAGNKRARVTVREGGADVAEIRISNRGRLPRNFDFSEGQAVGNGLGLVRTLIVSPGGSIAFHGGKNEVEVVLKLSAPLLAARH